MAGFDEDTTITLGFALGSVVLILFIAVWTTFYYFCCRKNQHIQYKETIYSHFNNRFSFASTAPVSERSYYNWNPSASLPSTTSCSCDHQQTTSMTSGEEYTPPLPPNHPTLDRHNPTRRLREEYNTYDSIEGVYSYCATSGLNPPQYQAPLPPTDQQTYTGLSHDTNTGTLVSTINRKGSDGLVTKPLNRNEPPTVPCRQDHSGGYIYLEEVKVEQQAQGQYDDINSLERHSTIHTGNQHIGPTHREQPHHTSHNHEADIQQTQLEQSLAVPQLKETIAQQPTEDYVLDGDEHQGVDNTLYFMDNDFTLTETVMQALDSDEKEAAVICYKQSNTQTVHHDHQGENNDAFVHEPDYYVDPQSIAVSDIHTNTDQAEIVTVTPQAPKPKPRLSKPDLHEI